MPTIDDNARRCETAGCFHTAWGSSLCSKCLEYRPPSTRGVATTRDWLYARLSGGEDLEVTRQRVSNTLDEGSSNEDAPPDEVPECPVCVNDCEDGDSLCPTCRNNVHRD